MRGQPAAGPCTGAGIDNWKDPGDQVRQRRSPVDLLGARVHNRDQRNDDSVNPKGEEKPFPPPEKEGAVWMIAAVQYTPGNEEHHGYRSNPGEPCLCVHMEQDDASERDHTKEIEE